MQVLKVGPRGSAGGSSLVIKNIWPDLVCEFFGGSDLDCEVYGSGLICSQPSSVDTAVLVEHPIKVVNAGSSSPE